MQVTHGDAIFLQVLDRIGTPEGAVAVVRAALSGEPYVPDFQGMIETGLVLPTEGTPPPGMSFTNLVTWARAAHAEALTRTYLRAPMNLSFYPFMVCKGKCVFCYVLPGLWAEKGMHPPEAWIKLMREARAMGVPFLSFLGGDPSHYPGIHELVRAADEIQIKSTLTTIGLRMPPELFEALTESSWVTPTVSIHSLDDYHTRVVGYPPDSGMARVRRMREAGKDVRVNLVWTQQSWGQILDVLKFCIDLEVTKLSIGIFFNINNVDVPVPSFSDYRELKERVEGWLAEHHPGKIQFTVEGCQIYTAYPDLQPPPTEFERLVSGCEAGNGRAEITSDGVLLPCALLDKDRWGDVNAIDVGLQLAWDTGQALQKIRELKNSQHQDVACGSCHLGSVCKGGCPAMNELTYGPDMYLQGGDTRCEIRAEMIQAGGLQPMGRRQLQLLTPPAVRKGHPQQVIPS